MINVWFRVDSSADLGEGHIRRCLNLAQQLPTHINTRFVCHQLTTNSISLLKGAGFENISLNELDNPENIINYISQIGGKHILIIDHYQLSLPFESIIKQQTNCQIVVIDDLADRKHDCDILIDASPIRQETDYKGLILNPLTKLLCGSRYLIFSTKLKQLHITKKQEKTHVFLGATDPLNASRKIADIVANKLNKACVLALTNSSNQGNINDLIGYEISKSEENFLDKMQQCHYAVGAPGTTLWERLALKCKVGCFSTAPSQINILEQLDKENICCYLGDLDQLSSQEIEENLRNFYEVRSKKLQVEKISHWFQLNSTQNVVSAILQNYPSLKSLYKKKVCIKPYAHSNAKRTVDWLNDQEIQSTFGFSRQIDTKAHTQWVNSQNNFYIWEIYFNEEHVGNTTIRLLNIKTAYFEIYLGDANIRGKGVGSLAFQLTAAWAFKHLNVEVIELISLKNNTAANKLYKKHNFKQLGTEQNKQLINGKYISQIKWALPKSDFNMREVI